MEFVREFLTTSPEDGLRMRIKV